MAREAMRAGGPPSSRGTGPPSKPSFSVSSAVCTASSSSMSSLYRFSRKVRALTCGTRHARLATRFGGQAAHQAGLPHEIGAGGRLRRTMFLPMADAFHAK